MWKDLNRVVGRGYRQVFLLSFCVGLLAESAVFIEGQTKVIFELLKEDLKIMLIVKERLPLDEFKNTEQKLSSLPHMQSAEFVSKDAGLKLLKEKDPELAKSVMLFGENPMPEFFEIKLDESALGSIGTWLEKNILNGKMSGIAGVSYKPEQVSAVLQAGFYNRFMNLVLAITGVIFGLFAFFVELNAVKAGPFLPSLKSASGWMLSGFFGGVSAMLFCWLLVYPMKYLSPMWWTYPSLGWHGAVLLANAWLGWALFRWKESH